MRWLLAFVLDFLSTDCVNDSDSNLDIFIGLNCAQTPVIRSCTFCGLPFRQTKTGIIYKCGRLSRRGMYNVNDLWSRRRTLRKSSERGLHT